MFCRWTMKARWMILCETMILFRKRDITERFRISINRNRRYEWSIVEIRWGIDWSLILKINSILFVFLSYENSPVDFEIEEGSTSMVVVVVEEMFARRRISPIDEKKNYFQYTRSMKLWIACSTSWSKWVFWKWLTDYRKQKNWLTSVCFHTKRRFTWL